MIPSRWFNHLDVQSYFFQRISTLWFVMNTCVSFFPLNFLKRLELLKVCLTSSYIICMISSYTVQFSMSTLKYRTSDFQLIICHLWLSILLTSSRSRLRQLLYLTTVSYSCQALFWLFSSRFFAYLIHEERDLILTYSHIGVKSNFTHFHDRKLKS